MKYLEFLNELKSYQDPAFAEFQKKLIPTKQKILGIRVPVMRTIAKRYRDRLEEIFEFPDDVFEVTFIKLTVLSLQPYDIFVERLERAVGSIDNWATCDSFKAKCIQKNREAFLAVLADLFEIGGEFYERYVLVVLLSEYVEERYLPILFAYLENADKSLYYVHMAAAWLTAEILIKSYENGIRFLQSGGLDVKTRNKAIQKAIESYRLTKEQKETLRSLKIKK